MRQEHRTKAKPPILLIHGGSGSYRGNRTELLELRRATIADLIAQIWPKLLGGAPALEIASQAVAFLEECPHFNAGRGGCLQNDGLVRLSASLMDGKRQKFSGVALATHMIHPSRLAYALQEKEQSVVGPLGAQLLARELGIPPENPIVPSRAEEWLLHLEKRSEEGGTVGAVVLDREGSLAAATSTGGTRGNVPERMSDSATVAGNYASPYAAISCTGIGEEIVNDGLAVRIETRVRDGGSVIQASELTMEEAKARGRSYGWIAIDRSGNWVSCNTTEDMPFGAMSRDLEIES